MLTIFDSIRGVSLTDVIVKLLFAVICGGMIGLEREHKRRPAGFRTHILICLGAAMTTLTSQFLCIQLKYDIDISRLGAQVVAGLGFIGAGTIIVTKHQRIKGLTTAAGLWTSGIIGLAFGSGFYEAGIATTVLILLAELLFSKLEFWMLRKSPEIMLYIQYNGKEALNQILDYCRKKNNKIINLELSRMLDEEKAESCAIFYLRLNKHCSLEQLLLYVNEVPGVNAVLEV